MGQRNGRLKVMSYNIRHGSGLDRVVDIGRIANVIRESGADIVGLQEVDRHFGERSRYMDQAKQLADAMEMYHAFGANLDMDPEQPGDPRRQYGTLTLSRYPIVEQRNHLLPLQIVPGEWNEQRGILETLLDVEGTRVAFLNTHLGLRMEERELQVKRILELPALSSGQAILVGDMNAKPDSGEMRLLAERMTDVLSERGFRESGTLWNMSKDNEAPRPSVRIDYIFTSPSICCGAASIIPAVASDHLAITVELELPDGEMPGI